MTLPQISDKYRWVVKRNMGDIITGQHFTIKLQKKRLFWWKTVIHTASPMSSGEEGISEAASRALFRYANYEDAKKLEGVVNGNPEYRAK
jgi:hypothetical protein